MCVVNILQTQFSGLERVSSLFDSLGRVYLSLSIWFSHHTLSGDTHFPLSSLQGSWKLTHSQRQQWTLIGLRYYILCHTMRSANAGLIQPAHSIMPRVAQPKAMPSFPWKSPSWCGRICDFWTSKLSSSLQSWAEDNEMSTPTLKEKCTET